MQQWSLSALCQGTSPCRSNASACLYGDSTVLVFGGRDAAGAATNDLHVLDLAGLAKGRGWEALACSGEPPSPRWGHGAFVFEQQLWVYGGSDGEQTFTDMWTLDLASLSWSKRQQRGVLPNRQLGKYKSFLATTVLAAGHSMLAFGMQQQDENADPVSKSGLRLYAFDLGQHKWSAVHTAGTPNFSKLEALQCHGNTLIALGWSGGKSESDMQVCCLDLSSISSCRTPSFTAGSTSRSRPTPSWQVVQAQGMLPSARTAAATAVLGSRLMLHGGVLCSKSVSGRLAADTFLLDLSKWSWTRMSAAQERAVGSNTINLPRASHMAVPVPSAAAVMLIGGTSSRQACASCDTIECLRQVGGGPALSTASFEGAADGAALGQGIAEMLSATPTLLGIQPFGHVTSTPTVVQQPSAAGTPNTGTVAPTPAVQLTSPFGAGAQAAAVAAAPPSSLVPTLDFSKFCFSNALSDIDLVAGGSTGTATYPAHRLLLCAQSPRFAELIMAQAGPSQVPGGECRWKLTLPDIYPDILGLMLQYMYCNLTSIPVESAALLFKAADRYGLSGLRSACLSVVIATIDLDNVCHSVLLAHDHKCSELSQACILFVAASPERFQQVLSTAGYLYMNQTHPRVGTAFVQSVTQLLMARRV